MTPVRDRRIGVAAAVLLTCTAYAAFNVSDLILKIMAGRFHFTEVMLINSSLIVLFLSAAGLAKEGGAAFRTGKIKLILARALITQVTAFCNILALPHLRLTTFYTLVFTAPLWVALLSVLAMKEKVGARRAGVIAFGFAVVLWIFEPGAGLPGPWMALVLLGAFAYACQLLIVRRLGHSESRFFIYASGSLLNVFLVAPFAASHFVMPVPQEWALFALMAAVGSAGLFCIATAFQSAAPAALLAPCHYTQLVWGAALGWLFLAETPDARVMAGAAAIIGAGLYLALGERRRARGKTLM